MRPGHLSRNLGGAWSPPPSHATQEAAHTMVSKSVRTLALSPLHPTLPYRSLPGNGCLPCPYLSHRSHRSLQPALTPLRRRVNPQRRTDPPLNRTARPPLSSRDVTETVHRPVSLRRSATESPGGCGALPLKPNEVLKSTLSTRGAHAQCWREGTPKRASRPESFSSAERRRAWTNTVCTDQSQRMQTK